MAARPDWCPHRDCGFLCSSQELVCVGRLPKPDPHGDLMNTHRMCIHGAKDDGEWTFDLKVHNGDAWNLRRMLNVIMNDHRGANHAG